MLCFYAILTPVNKKVYNQLANDSVIKEESITCNYSSTCCVSFRQVAETKGEDHAIFPF